MLRKQTNLKGLFENYKNPEIFFLYKEYKENTFTIEIEDSCEAP